MAGTFSSDLQRAECKGTYAFMSLGCPKNLVDSERMLGLLQLDGYQLVAEPEGADLAIVNTCGFIESARGDDVTPGVVLLGLFVGRRVASDCAVGLCLDPADGA